MLRQRIFNNLLLFTLVPLMLILIIVCFTVSQRNIKSAKDEVGSRAAESAELINRLLDKYIDKSSFIITNPYLLRNIQINYKGEMEQNYYFSTNISSIIGEPFDGNSKRPIIIYTSNETLFEGKFLEHLATKGFPPAMAETLKAPSSRIVWEQALTEKNDRKYMTFYRNIVDYKSSVGLLEVNIPYREVERELDVRGTPSQGLVLALDASGHTIYFSNLTLKKDVAAQEITSKHYYLSEGELKNGHTIITAIPKSAIYRQTIRTGGILLICFLFYIAVILLASRTSSRKITENLERFMNRLKNNEEVLLHEDLIQIKGNNEVSVIKSKFKELLSRMNEIYREMVDIRLEKSRAELELLQSRINPHLLYNSLSVIKWNAIWSKDDKTVRMINALTNYYRKALNKGNDILTIASELEMIQEYVKINTYANSCEYRLIIFVEHGILEYSTLKHLLQPIVENSIVHAFNLTEANPQIRIKGYRQGEDLIFVVTDNGCGMTKETINKIKDPAYMAGYGGYGIKNLIRRIESYYGPSYGVEMESEVGAGTKVTVKIAAEIQEHRQERKGGPVPENL
ncbi:sensor histidine kinase [Cohnella silvisoli]|uniref:Histidine kinase n=1 Tax=Cohnella silvisoli TaxID=2873699 RepID=A0ABV1L431_9BACL|nr:histidine kinase [Cohnella silvisoli]MCD9021617.1 histidine kinase [Cohnella silvisoli]